MSFSRPSINTASSDMSDREREVSARHAGHLLYGAIGNNGNSRSVANDSLSSDDIILPEDRQACCHVMSPVRRTFCLLCLFDLLISFILWIIYTQVTGKPLLDTIRYDVVHYDIKFSLFDTVMLSAWRFVPLLLAYALFKSRKPWFVAITTAGSCAFLIAKVFLYDFSTENDNLMCYFLIVASFILAWAETWFLDFKVLPREQKAREREAFYRTIHERQPLLSSTEYNYTNNTGDEYYSPIESREGSDDEDQQGGSFQSVPHSQSHSRTHSRGSGVSVTFSLGTQEKEFLQKSRDVWEETWDMLNLEAGWAHQNGKDLESGCVHAKTFPRIGKVYRLQGYVDCNQRALFQEIVLRIQDAPKWSPTVLESKVLHIIDDTTDIIYTVAAESAGGIVSSRDFVSVRHWGTREGILLSAGVAVDYTDAPVSSKHVRGENGPCLWAFKQVPGNKNRTIIIQLLNTDLKGWIPQAAIDRALGTVLLNYLTDIRKHMKKVTKSSVYR